MLSTRGRYFQGTNFVPARETVEHEFAEIRRNRGGADETDQRRPPQLRHGPQRGESRARPQRAALSLSTRRNAHIVVQQTKQNIHFMKIHLIAFVSQSTILCFLTFLIRTIYGSLMSYSYKFNEHLQSHLHRITSIQDAVLFDFVVVSFVT